MRRQIAAWPSPSVPNLDVHEGTPLASRADPLVEVEADATAGGRVLGHALETRELGKGGGRGRGRERGREGRGVKAELTNRVDEERSEENGKEERGRRRRLPAGQGRKSHPRAAACAGRARRRS